jgi:hypothetical protein
MTQPAEKMFKASKCKKTESVLLKWIRQKQTYMPVQGPMLSQKAEEITLKLNIEFTPSNGGWIDSENWKILWFLNHYAPPLH